MMTTNSKYIAICTLFILNTGSALATGGVTNTAGPRLIDILDNTQAGLNGDEGSIGYVTYNQVDGNLLIDVHVVKAPSAVDPSCDPDLGAGPVEVELVVQSPDGSSPDWATGGIQEEGVGAHFGLGCPPNCLGPMTLNPTGEAAFKISTRAGGGAGAIEGAQKVGLRNYGHINLESPDSPGPPQGCDLEVDQLGASRVEWITTP